MLRIRGPTRDISGVTAPAQPRRAVTEAETPTRLAALARRPARAAGAEVALVVVAHGAFEQLASKMGASGAVAPADRRAEVESIFARESAATADAPALADLPSPTRAAVTRAPESDRFPRAHAAGPERAAHAAASRSRVVRTCTNVTGPRR